MNHSCNIYIFGEVLFDCFPDGSRVLGGAPFNVAWHLEAFGLHPQLISRVGDDLEGQEIAASMKNWGMRCDALQIDKTKPTGQVQVNICAGEPHYDIVIDSAYDFIAAELLSPTDTGGILYHGTLALRNPIALAALQAFKSRHQGKIFVDVNLRDPWWQKETLVPLLNDANWVKLNEGELVEICPQGLDFESAIKFFYQQFALDLLIVTRGKEGAIVCREGHLISVEPVVCRNVVDTVGAGDAFSTIFLLGLCKQWSIETTLDRAQVFAGELVSRRGATVSDREFYRAFSQAWNQAI